MHRPATDAILVIDDEPQLRRAIRTVLAPLSRQFLEAATGAEGLSLARTVKPDLVILDLALPDMEGVDVCRDIRASSETPIIVLSARHAENDKVDLLTAGADDYVTKPFGLRELEARVRVQLRRVIHDGERPTLPIVRVGPIVIDMDARRVTHEGNVVRLTGLEWKLLRALAINTGRTLTHHQLFDLVWERRFGDPQHYLRVLLTKLRRKVEPDRSNPVLILTEPGVGYRFELPTTTGVTKDVKIWRLARNRD